jgi:hypothetical protein
VNELEIRAEQPPLLIDIQRGAAIARQLRDYLRQARMTCACRAAASMYGLKGSRCCATCFSRPTITPNCACPREGFALLSPRAGLSEEVPDETL